MLRSFAAAIAALMLLVAPALAGDRAVFNFIGYSEDQKYAAFEEFGEYDGAGGFYSHIYVVNLVDDSWVSGSPYLVEPNPDVVEDTMPLAEVRAKALALAKPKLKALKIGRPAETLYLLGDGLSNPQGKTVTLSTPTYYGWADDAYVITLGLTAVKSDTCPQDMTDLTGFTLEVDDDSGKHSVHDDGKAPLPKSRGCTTDYRIYAILKPFDGGAAIAVISTYAHGFEGLDRRFMLVPLGYL